MLPERQFVVRYKCQVCDYEFDQIEKEEAD